MAEAPVAGPFGGRPLIIVVTAVIIVVFIFLMVGLRSCTGGVASKDQYTVIYSNLELKDTAAIIAKLKELKITYRVKDEGRAIAVPKDKADDARLGLAETGLPMGGAVGWEIFDQAKLGATDFDRRIQFIRAVSGELSRTINRISAVEDSRVQIVIPETKLFEAATSPVTASVLLKVREGRSLTTKQINGIVHLVASSVENLKKENVTIIDTNGNILSAAGYVLVPLVEKPEVRLPEEKKPETEERAPSEEEKLLMEIKAKQTMEEQLTSKVQSLINRMYPPNSIIARVNVESLPGKKTTVIILLDEKLKIDKQLKTNTIDTVAAAVGYNEKRGDKIIMKRVPFREAVAVKTIPPLKTEVAAGKKIIKAEKGENVVIVLAKKGISLFKTLVRKYGAMRVGVGIGLGLIFVMFFVLPLFGGGKKRQADTVRKEEIAAEKQEAEKIEAAPQVSIDKVMDHVARDPEAVAEMLTSWVREQG